MLEIVKELVIKGIDVTLKFDADRNEMYADLNTDTKSHLYLYENGMLRGRYDYEKQIDLSHNIDNLIIALCNEFEHATYGRSFGNSNWIDLCDENNVKLGMTL
jgi:hypothetical protein